MTPKTQLSVSLNLGAEVGLDVLAKAVEDLNTVCQFGASLQDGVSRSTALREVLREPGRWLSNYPELFDPYLSRSGYVAAALLGGAGGGTSRAVERAVASYLREFDLETDSDVFVAGLRYENPLTGELIVAAGGVIETLLLILGNWASVRRTYAARGRSAIAQARIDEARAADYEDQVRSRREVRAIVVGEIASGQYSLRPDQIDSLLDDTVASAMNRLGSADVDVQRPIAEEDDLVDGQ
ncbi:hypothetical protein [Jatrophihabitans lederbergiae]|uniref:Uncharacterized protein n=1 Tax=Jatrophihabitans lederbergiae TaxID=3075547 RepID=A0ABU2JFE7_9ACTN|nr:hypothetical protein [Jatrophihabitans sp. DSM 44399]MDT0263409.1 hypothetical protein [Jatrophihabitans sp. DSM 44399]